MNRRTTSIHIGLRFHKNNVKPIDYTLGVVCIKAGFFRRETIVSEKGINNGKTNVVAGLGILTTWVAQTRHHINSAVSHKENLLLCSLFYGFFLKALFVVGRAASRMYDGEDGEVNLMGNLNILTQNNL